LICPTATTWLCTEYVTLKRHATTGKYMYNSQQLF